MIRYEQTKQLEIQAVLDLYAAVEWTNYTNQPAMLEQALTNSLYVLAAFDGEKVVGLLRAVGDGYSIVFIQDLLVLPDYQRQGIGSQLLRQVLAAFPSVYQLHLLTSQEERTKQFYEALGFVDVADYQCLAYTYAGLRNG